MQKKQTLQLFFVFLILIMALAAGCAPKSPEAVAVPADVQADSGTQELETGPFKDMSAPDFTLRDMEGKEWILSELKGNSVALVFFTSW